MSMKLMQQLQRDHINIQDIKNKKEKNYDKEFSKMNENLKELKEDIDEKLKNIMVLLRNRTSETIIVTEDKYKTNTVEHNPTFIPDIDTSDMSMNTKENEEEENLKDVDIDEGLDVLNKLIK